MVIPALAALCEEYYQAEPGQADAQMQGEMNVIPHLHLSSLLSESKTVKCFYLLCTHTDVLVSQYAEGLKSREMHTRCCSSLALGCLPRFMIQSKLKQVCQETVTCNTSVPQYVTVCLYVYLNLL